MKYNGKLYGKVGGIYFDTGLTSNDWDELESKANMKWNNMKIYRVTFDTIMLTIVLDYDKDIKDFLLESNDYYCNNFYINNNDIYQKWDETYSEKVSIVDITNERGIVHSESH